MDFQEIKNSSYIPSSVDILSWHRHSQDTHVAHMGSPEVHLDTYPPLHFDLLEVQWISRKSKWRGEYVSKLIPGDPMWGTAATGRPLKSFINATKTWHFEKLLDSQKTKIEGRVCVQMDFRRPHVCHMRVLRVSVARR